MAPQRLAVYNFVDSCSSSTSNKRSSSSKDIGEGGAGSAGKGGKTATGPVGSAGPGRNWGAQAGSKRVQPTRGWTVAASTQHKLYSLLLPPAMGARFYRFLGRPAKWTRWLAGAAAIKSG